MTFFRTLLIAAAIAAPVVYPSLSSAIEFKAARAKKMIIELKTGYVKAADPSNAEIAAIVKDTNARRKLSYEAVAQENGSTAAAAGQAMAKKIKAKLGK